MKMKSLAKIVFLLFLPGFFCGCTKQAEIQNFTFSGMGTVLSVIYTGERNEALENAVKKDAGIVESELSYYKDSSFVSILNREAHEKEIEVPPHVCRLIEKSLEYGEMSGGVFDITYKSTGELWENNGNKIPDDKIIEEKQQFVGGDKLKVNCTENKIKFANKGVKMAPKRRANILRTSWGILEKVCTNSPRTRIGYNEANYTKVSTRICTTRRGFLLYKRDV